MNDVSTDRPQAIVVDDEALIRTFAADILRDAGFITHEAKDADEAFRLLEQYHCPQCLLFSDVRMPGSRDGLALAKQTAATWPDVKIVLASGYSTPTAGELPAGALFISKPYSTDMVRSGIGKLFPNS